jgi:hypothetical protein
VWRVRVSWCVCSTLRMAGTAGWDGQLRWQAMCCQVNQTRPLRTMCYDT